MINHIMRKDLEYIYKDNNLNRHWRKLDIEERRFIDDLIEYFRPYNEKLYKLLDRDFDWDK